MTRNLTLTGRIVTVTPAVLERSVAARWRPDPPTDTEAVELAIREQLVTQSGSRPARVAVLGDWLEVDYERPTQTDHSGHSGGPLRLVYRTPVAVRWWIDRWRSAYPHPGEPLTFQLGAPEIV